MILWEAGKHEVKEVQNESVLIVIFRIGYYKTEARTKVKKGPVIFCITFARFSKFRFKPERKGKAQRATNDRQVTKEGLHRGRRPQPPDERNSLGRVRTPNSAGFIFGELHQRRPQIYFMSYLRTFESNGPDGPPVQRRVRS